ncbi:MAG: proteasome assembly chaperone family protein [Theionarchaea archaeon]|nr:MAG: hypothetical protein AYK18_05890 [Theionarchaea archaeon DG-70]MBU7010703.1 proteasome assembly chaperone family protein [Theionarchaea archaeon]
MTEIVEKKPINLEGGTAIEAFPGVGLVGHIAGSYMISALDMELAGHISAENLPPLSIVYKGSIIPPLRIYTHDTTTLFIADIPIPSDSVYDITKEIAAFLKKKRARMSISLAGIGIGKQGENVFAAATEEKLLEEIKVEALEIGSIVGASGSLLLECKRLHIPGVGLLAETVGNVPDPRAAAKLVEEIGRILNLKIDVQPLLEEAEGVEEKLEQMIEEMRRKEEAGEYVPMYR